MDFNYEPKTVLNAEDIAKIRKEINEITISETLEKYIIELVFATRNPAEYGLTQEAGYIQFGASPRASIQLNLAAKVMAYLEGRDYVLPEDIKEMAPDILNHRIILNYVAEADNITTLQIIQSILSSVAINR
jgi:MoxR-like ATPase